MKLLTKLSVRIIFFALMLFPVTQVCSQAGNGALLNKWQTAKSRKNYLNDTSNVRLLNQLAERYLYNNADSALYFAKQALRIAQVQKSSLGQAISFDNISKTYYVMGDYMLSMEASASLMNVSSKINYQAGVGSAYQNTGLIFLAQDKFNTSISYFSKALDIYVKLKDHAKIARAYLDLGICYDELRQAGKAFDCLNKSISSAAIAGDKNLALMAVNRTGETYFHLNNYDKALVYYKQVIDSNPDDNWEKDFAYSGIAQSYYKLGQYKQAIIDGQKSLALARKVNSQYDAVRALEIICESFVALKEFKQAYHYQVMLKKSSDSLFNSEKEKEVNFLHLKQQQADIVRLENELKAKQEAIDYSKRLLMFRNLIAVIFVIFLIIIIQSNRQKTSLNKVLRQQNADIALQKEEILQQKDALAKLNQTKDQLFSVISHDLRSPFAAILPAIEAIRQGELTVEVADVILEDFHRQVNLLTLMMNNMLVWANNQQQGITTEQTTFSLSEPVKEIIAISNFWAKNKGIDIDHHAEGQQLIKADINHIKIIIQNLIGNAIKFTPEGGAIEVFYSDDQNYWVLHVKDNGVGISSEKIAKLFKVMGKDISGYGTNNEAGTGIGLTLIKQFVDANDGKLEVQSGPSQGTEFRVYFKKA